MKKVHVVPHTHWDREWYFTSARAEIFFVNNFQDIIETLENDPKFKYFILDGQTSLLDDYMKYRPEDFKRIVNLVKDGKLIIGPWYTQTDQMLISGESIIRNLYYGIKTALKFGDYQNVAYVPDSFGQSGAMPQIYNQFQMNKTLFWRGVTDEMTDDKEFIWQGNDGSKVYTVQMPDGYYIGGNIPENPDEGYEFWKEEALGIAGERTSTSNIYFPHGFDQAPIRKNLPELIERQQELDPENEYFISNIEKYFESVIEEKEEYEKVFGELTYAKHSRIHKSIYSSRSDIKALNTITQNYLVNVMEPMLVIADSLGFDYPHRAVEKIWKIMLQNAAHDAIGSCVSDEANEVIKMRYKNVIDLATNLVDLNQRNIAMNIECSRGLNLFIYNYLPYSLSRDIVYEGFVPYKEFTILNDNNESIPYTILEEKDMTNYVLSNRIQLDPSKDIEKPNFIRKVKMVFHAENLPALGYTTFHISEGQGKNRPLQQEEKEFIENEFYLISVESNGSLRIKDKKTGKVYKNQAVIVDNGDGGDSFDYSPPKEDFKIYSTNSEYDYSIQTSENYSEININYEMKLPYNLKERAKKITSTKQKVELKVKIGYSRIISFEFKTDNKVLSHRMVILIDSGIASQTSVADHQFGVIERPVYYEKEMNSYFENSRSDFSLDKLDSDNIPIANQVQNSSGWQQPTIAIEPTQSYVSLTNEKNTVAVFPKGVREYEIVGNDYSIISLTLFRTYGYMGKENLKYRPGRASGEKTIATPDAQLIGDLSFEFGVGYFNDSFDESNVAKIAREFNTPALTYGYAEFLNGRLYFSQYPIENPDFEKQYSLLSLDGSSIFSSIVKSQQSDSYLLRVFNGFKGKNSDVSIEGSNAKSIKRVDLLENTLDTNGMEKSLKFNEFATFKIQ